MKNEDMTDKKRGVAQCPACEFTMRRIGRTLFMHVFIGSKRFYCRDCGQEYLLFFGHYFHCGL